MVQPYVPSKSSKTDHAGKKLTFTGSNDTITHFNKRFKYGSYNNRYGQYRPSFNNCDKNESNNYKSYQKSSDSCTGSTSERNNRKKTRFTFEDRHSAILCMRNNSNSCGADHYMIASATVRSGVRIKNQDEVKAHTYIKGKCFWSSNLQKKIQLLKRPILFRFWIL